MLHRGAAARPRGHNDSEFVLSLHLEDSVAQETTRPLRIDHVVAGIHQRDGGTSYSVPRLAEELSKLGHDVRLHTLEPRPQRDPDLPTIYYRRLGTARALGISPEMRRGLRDAARAADIIHFHGLWTMPSVYPAFAVRGTSCRLVMSPRGMLDPWAMAWHARRKRIFGWVLQNRALAAVDCFHATSIAERDAILGHSLAAPTAVVPNGVDIPPSVTFDRHPPRVVTYLGRLHPKKNVDGLIRAWAQVQKRHPAWHLDIAGEGEPEYVSLLNQLAGGTERVSIR
ncbi:glycosyltransferase, partial [Actinomycetota bacterium]